MESSRGYEELARFVARMKLTELDRQHARLAAAYTKIERTAHDASSEAAAACAMWDGLQALRVANRALHPELDDISMLRAMVDAEVEADEIGATWVERLQRELDQGRARARVAHLFGRLLDEHTAESVGAEVPAEAAELLANWTASMHEPPRPTAHAKLFDDLFAEIDPDELEAVRERVARMLDDTEDLRHYMNDFPGDLAEVCGPAELEVAQRVADDDMSLRELTDAMCIMVENLETWDWPDAIEHEVRWTRNRWRVYPREPLSVAAFVEVAGSWALDAVHSSLGDAAEQRADRLARLIELDAPAIIIENERRMLAEATTLGSPDNVVFDSVVDEAVGLERRVELRNLRRQSETGSYDYDNTLTKAASLVAAEVRLQRVAHPDAPVWVIKTDIENFYPRVEHAVVLDLLDRLGVTAPWSALVARFLAIPVDGTPAQRGLPMGHRPSRGLGELLLHFMDLFVSRRANVRIIRAVDDICILAAEATEAIAAYRAVEEFLAACGLSINASKSGSTAVGGDPAELAGAPRGAVRWGLLTLDADGTWSVDLDAVDERIAQAHARVGAAAGVLRRVDAFNDEARGLIAFLGLPFDFGSEHRQHVREAVGRFTTAVGGVALTDALRPNAASDEPAVGVAWLRWPITAGGLGLYDPFVDILSYELSREGFTFPRVPAIDAEGWKEAAAQWADYYRALVRELLPATPKRGTHTDALVDDFVARNRELHGSASADDLSPYWRWTLHTYGPEILERFGTFRFLLTELVPLRLILQERHQ